MENSKVMKVMLIIAIVFFLVMVGLGVFNIYKSKNNTNPNLIPNNSTTNVIDDASENKDEYVALEEISGDYTLERAISDNCYVIDKLNVPHNEDVLNNFVNELSNSGDLKIRVVTETLDSLLYIIDVETSGDSFVVTQNDVQLGGSIQANEYSMSKGYFLANELVILGDGTRLQSYYISKTDSEDKVNLFAYVLGTQNEVVESGEI